MMRKNKNEDILQDMIKALEGARKQLFNNRVEITNLVNKFNLMADEIDDVTHNYSKVILSKAIDELIYGVMLDNEDYSNFTIITDKHFKKTFCWLNFVDYLKIERICTIFFSWYNTQTQQEEIALRPRPLAPRHPAGGPCHRR